jgi:hypothetical protein
MTENHRYNLGVYNSTSDPANNPFGNLLGVNAKVEGQVDFTNYYSYSGKKDTEKDKKEIIETLFEDDENPKTIENVFGLNKEDQNDQVVKGFNVPVNDDKFTILENNSQFRTNGNLFDSQDEIKNNTGRIIGIDDLMEKLELPDTERKKVTEIDFFHGIQQDMVVKPNNGFLDSAKNDNISAKPNNVDFFSILNNGSIVQNNNTGYTGLDGGNTHTPVEQVKISTQDEFLANFANKEEKKSNKEINFFEQKKEVVTKETNFSFNNNNNTQVNHSAHPFEFSNNVAQSTNEFSKTDQKVRFENQNFDFLNNFDKPKNQDNKAFDFNSGIDFGSIQFNLKNDPVPLVSEKRFSTTNQRKADNHIHIENHINLKDFNSSHSLHPKKFITLHNIEGEASYGKLKAKETSSTISLRKSKLFNDDGFSTSKSNFSNKNLTPYLELDNETLNYQILSIFEEMLCNIDINRTKEQFITFFLDEYLHQSPISPLSTLDSMLDFTELSKVNGLKTGLSSEIHSWRLILGDGNCYYRAFMFAMIENFILNKDLYSIKKLLFDINNIIGTQFNKKNEVIDKSEMNIAFYLILDCLDNNCIQEAYDIFIKSYYVYKTFDYGLIKYMRIALYKYIDANKNKIYGVESQVELGNLLPSAYIQKTGYNFKAFFEEYLLCMHNEAENIIIYLSPIVFNINLDLYIIEGTAHLQTSKKNFFKQSINCLKNGQNAKISLLYRFNHYDCLYSHLMYERNFRNITYQAEGYRKTRFEVFTECPCESCGQYSELITFYHIPNNPLCRNCLIMTLVRIMITRIKAYISEFYINKECIYKLNKF